jgi:Ca-activated chloride channel family protein
VGRPLSDAIAAAKAAKVPVSTIAFGTQNGTVTYQGETISVPADDTALSAIASQTGGSFHTAHSASELESVYRNIGSQIGYTTKHREISWRFLLIGALLAFAAGGTSMLWSGRLV